VMQGRRGDWSGGEGEGMRGEGKGGEGAGEGEAPTTSHFTI